MLNSSNASDRRHVNAPPSSLAKLYRQPHLLQTHVSTPQDPPQASHFSESIRRYLTGPQPYSKTVHNHTVKICFYFPSRSY